MQDTQEDKKEESQKRFVVVVQCDRVVHDTCSGFQCEWAFSTRQDAFSRYPADAPVRYMTISCGGCPGLATHRKLMNIAKNLKKRQNLTRDIVMVHLSSCITRSNHHGPRCPHIDYIKTLIGRAGFDYVEDSRLSPKAGQRRADGMYRD